MIFLESIYRNRIAYIKILIILCILSYIIIRLLYNYLYDDIKKNWNRYNKNIFIAPLAGFFRNVQGKSWFSIGTGSVLSLIWTYIKLFFNTLIKPFKYIIDIVKKILDSFKTILDKFRQQLGVIRRLLLQIVKTVMERLQNLMATFIQMFMRLREIIKRSFASFRLIVYTVQTISLTLKSMMTGPVGDLAKLAANLGNVFTFFLLGPLSFLMFPNLWYCVFCFQGDSIVQLENNIYKKIKNICLEDSIYNSKVIGTQVFYNINNTPLYNLEDTIVTGGHLVYKENKWNPVSKYGHLYKKSKNDNLLYCLSTSDNKIKINNNIFIDYDETYNIKILLEQRLLLLSILNNNIYFTNKNFAHHLYQEGFCLENLYYLKYLSKFTSKHLPYKCNISNNTFIGIGKWLSTNDTIWYKHIKTGLLLTGSSIILEENKWIPVYTSRFFRKSNKTCKIIYNWTTPNNIIQFGNMKIRDLLGINSPYYHQYCTNLSI